MKFRIMEQSLQPPHLLGPLCFSCVMLLCRAATQRAAGRVEVPCVSAPGAEQSGDKFQPITRSAIMRAQRYGKSKFFDSLAAGGTDEMPALPALARSCSRSSRNASSV